MPCFHAFTDKDASCPAVWAAMLFTLSCITTVWMWTILALISCVVHGPATIATLCPGSSLWYSLLANALVTGGSAAVLVKMTMNAHAGHPVLGQQWTRSSKKRVVAGLGAVWLSLWTWAGFTTMGSCGGGRLKTNQLRIINLVWFWSFPTAFLVIQGARVVKAVSLRKRSAEESGVCAEAKWPGRVVI